MFGHWGGQRARRDAAVARFGQLGYFNNQDYGLALTDLNSWNPTNGIFILVGTWEDIGQASVTTNITNLSKPLQPAQATDHSGGRRQCGRVPGRR